MMGIETVVKGVIIGTSTMDLVSCLRSRVTVGKTVQPRSRKDSASQISLSKPPETCVECSRLIGKSTLYTVACFDYVILSTSSSARGR